MPYDDIEQQRIADYARGWNAGSTGRAPIANPPLSYILGYMDATH